MAPSHICPTGLLPWYHSRHHGFELEASGNGKHLKPPPKSLLREQKTNFSKKHHASKFFRAALGLFNFSSLYYSNYVVRSSRITDSL